MIVEVASEKNPEIRYTVDTETGECTCPHWTQRLSKLNAEDGGERRCKHYATAKALETVKA